MVDMKVLAIETSCDETGVAILEGGEFAGSYSFTTLAEALLSQAALHSDYGGVYPTLAKREHEKNLPVIFEQALAKAGMKEPPPVDAIVVTAGPGLEPALWTGITFAQDLAKKWKKPLFASNHLEGHLVSALVQDGILADTAFPILGLIVSGGHSQFVRADGWFRYSLVGETLDDAVGECFDKVARMLGLSYPGGPQVSKLAKQAREKGLPQSTAKLPRPMIHADNCDVSFSGLKTAALYALRNMGGVEALSEHDKAAFAREFEDSVADVFVAKARRALMQTGATTFALGGGVAANEHLRARLTAALEKDFPDLVIRMPDPATTGDNAVMIAQAALLHFLTGDWTLDKPHADIKADGNLSLEKTA